MAKADVDDIEAYFARKEMAKAPAWRPDPGTTVKAEVIGLRMGDGGEYGPYPIVIYRGESGNVFAVHAFHTLLRERLAELGTTIGLWQYITYEGRRESTKRKDASGNAVQYHDYYAENVGAESTVEGKEEGFHF